MSRIGKKIINHENNVKLSLNDNFVVITGPKGTLSVKQIDCLNVKYNENTVAIEARDNESKTKAFWGLQRTLISNAIEGVTNGFTKTLEFNGVGYKASVTNSKMTLSLGYSHPIEYDLPEMVSAKVVKNQIILESIDKELLGQVAAKIRSFRPPEPYKGKGVKYIDEVIIRKAGKTGSKK